MTKTTTIESFQAAQTDDEQQPESTGNYLRDLAERALRDRGGELPHVGDPFDGLDLDIDPADAYGLVEHQVTEWLRERDRWATPLEVEHKTKQLMAEAQNARPGPVKAATYTVEGGVVTSFTPDAAPAELPGMPQAPEPINGLRVPSDSIFGDDSEFSMSSALMQRARTLIERHPDHLKHLESMSVLYLWKKSGGKSKGRATFGKCSKPSGLLKHFSEAQFVIWLAADHCRAAAFDDRQLEALLFHEMLHTAVAEPDENTGRGGGPTLVPHELEVFRAEVEIYGLWAPELKEIAPAFRQAPLFGISPEEMAYFDAAGDEMEADIASGAYVPDRPEGSTVADAPLVCSVCKNPVWEHELSPEEVSEARQNPSVVLCEACGEDGIIEDEDAG